MLRVINPADELLAYRVLELLAPTALWQRSLWNIGISLAIKELLESCTAHQAGTLGEPSVRRLGSYCSRIAGKDPAVHPNEKPILNEFLRNIPRVDGRSYNGLKQLGEQIERDYLLRWSAQLRAPGAYNIERAARSIACYMLDQGFSETYLHQWWQQHIEAGGNAQSISEICEDAHAAFSVTQLNSFEVLIAFRRAPRSASGYPRDWLPAANVSEWLEHNGSSTADIRPCGGLVLPVQSRDYIAAGQAGMALLDGYVARASIGTGRPLEPIPHIWVKGHATPFAYEVKRRGVRVKALYREDQIFNAAQNSNVDAAIDLLAHLENSSPTAAISGGWAAMEALLGEPSDRSAAADSLASLVACSIPRAELTFLSYTIERTTPALAPVLRRSRTNRDRAALVAEAIARGDALNLSNATDRAAVLRLDRIVTDPAGLLGSLTVSVAESFHRLYRQRNLILHAGMTSSVVLPHVLRTVSKVAGAGIDRIAHGFYVQKLRPLELAARARIAIATASPGNPTCCVDLLGA